MMILAKRLRSGFTPGAEPVIFTGLKGNFGGGSGCNRGLVGHKIELAVSFLTSRQAPHIRNLAI
jgi:hypothetical protein